jgi:hypothetical protein
VCMCMCMCMCVCVCVCVCGCIVFTGTYMWQQGAALNECDFALHEGNASARQGAHNNARFSSKAPVQETKGVMRRVCLLRSARHQACDHAAHVLPTYKRCCTPKFSLVYKGLQSGMAAPQMSMPLPPEHKRDCTNTQKACPLSFWNKA